MDSENYFSSRYLTIVGHVQSGKTYEEMNYCFASVKRGFPVFFITRNITADQLQLNARFIEFNKTMKKPLDVFLLSHNDVSSIAKRMESPCIIILLCNQFQLKKVKNVLYMYKGEYNVCIDEVDFAIKTKYGTSELDTMLNQIKEGANHILGATATPIAVFTTQKEMGKIIKIKPTKNYHGVNSLNIEMIESSITSDPATDHESIYKIYSSLLDKHSAVLLHTVTKKKKNHESLMEYISDLFPTFTYIIYNGDGIQVLCKGRNDTPFTRPKSINQYGQFINKYHYNNDIHHFFNYSIAEVLQILVDDYHQHTHISIFAGQLASRGVSFVSTDYSLHLTDQYFHAGKLTHGENYLQSLRILGCYKDNPILTLWCSEHSWKLILDHNKIINSLVESVEGCTKWLQKIKKVIINKPETPLSRPKIVSKVRRISKSHFFSLDISSDEEEEEIF